MTAPLQQTERQFQTAVIDLARQLGWRTAHFHDSRREVRRRDGSTRMIGDRDAAAWPDLALARNGRLVLAELKSETGRLSVAQREWLDALDFDSEDLRIAAHIDLPRLMVCVWRPHDWGQIQGILR